MQTCIMLEIKLTLRNIGGNNSRHCNKGIHVERGFILTAGRQQVVFADWNSQHIRKMTDISFCPKGKLMRRSQNCCKCRKRQTLFISAQFVHVNAHRDDNWTFWWCLLNSEIHLTLFHTLSQMEWSQIFSFSFFCPPAKSLFLKTMLSLTLTSSLRLTCSFL